MQTTERYCMGCMRDNGGETICRFCGFNESRPHEAFALPLRSWLAGRYMTGAIKDLNGEGITYIAWDSVQQEPVFIREYFPQGFCERYLRLSGVKIHRDQAKTYDEGMDAFISLAEDLSRMGALQGLLPVRDIFEDNGTAYYAYESVESIKLKEFLLRNGGTLKWDQARPLFLSIIPTLTALHGAGILHCGISHDTLLVGRDGKMRVTGFCIEQVRNARSDFKSQLFSGYAAIEQYGFKGQIGSATDVYALGAAIYRTLVGRPPPPATERVTDDRMTIPYFIAQNLPEDVITALSGALQILPAERTGSIEEFRNGLSAPPRVQGRGTQFSSKQYRAARHEYRKDEDEDEFEDAPHTSGKNAIWIILAGILLLGGALAALVLTVFKPSPMSGVEPSSIESEVSGAPSYIYSGSNAASETGPMLEMPDFVGSTYARAMESGNKGKYKFEIVKEYNDAARGTIFEQSPAADMFAPETATVILKISLGPEFVEVPPSYGYSYNDVYLMLLELGFEPEMISATPGYDESAPPGVVLYTEPAEGESASREYGIEIFTNSYEPPPPESEAPPEGDGSGGEDTGGTGEDTGGGEGAG